MENHDRPGVERLIPLLLALLTTLVFVQVSGNDFIRFDDPYYVYLNTHVRDGLSIKEALWAVTTTFNANWHPLAWLSHMLDVQLFGLNPGAHHIVNLLFHVVNTLLLYGLLRMMTGLTWESAFAAALFAVHPLHVESVAWVSERKDVLSTFFMLLTMRYYARYAALPSTGRFLPVVLFYLLGLLAKPMLVTLPFLLLLLDYWPLRRVCDGQSAEIVPPSTFARASLPLLREKIPLFMMSAASSVITYVAQETAGAMNTMDDVTAWMRVGNAVVSYVKYIGKMFWPSSLAIYYPHPAGSLPGWQIAGSALFLSVLSFLAVRFAARRPYFPVGWFWFLGTMVPVIGLVQVGKQGMADRYTYVPMTGLFIILAWGVPELLEGWRRRRETLSVLAASSILAFGAVSWAQVGYWRDTVTLFGHALDVTSGNWLAEYNLALTLDSQGKTDEAILHYRNAVRIIPQFGSPYRDLGKALAGKGRLDEAIVHYRRALSILPEYAEAHKELGTALARQGKTEEALRHYREALRIKPDFAEAHNDMGMALGRRSMPDEAIGHYREALRIRPDFAEAHNNLGAALAERGRAGEAVHHFREALRINPEFTEAQRNLQAVLAYGRREGGQAR